MSGPWEKYQAPTEPAGPWEKYSPTVAGKPTPANAGLANFMASTAGLPVDATENVLNLGIATVGRLSGRTPELLKDSVGGSEWIKNKLRQTAEPGLSPDNPSTSKLGDLAFKMMSRGGFLPGGVVSAASSIGAEEAGGPQWAGVGALAPQAAISAYNAARAPSLARQESENAVRDRTLREGQELGYVVPPSSSGGGFVSRRLESIGGKAAVGQEAAVRNQKVTNEIVREELGLPKHVAVSEQTLENYRDRMAAPYREVAAIDQEAAQALKDLKQARFDANANYKFYNRHPDPAVLEKANSFKQRASSLESYLEDIAANASKPQLVDELRHARKMIAKSYDAEQALNIGTGDFNARSLGKALDNGKPLTGGLATAGRFAEAFPAYTREGATIPTPGVSKSEALASVMLGLGGFAASGGNPLGLAAAALPLASGPVRSTVLSGPYQSMARPSYDPALKPESQLQSLIRLGILNGGSLEDLQSR
jgi:hypothetical protein